jgi:hypothetical protein
MASFYREYGNLELLATFHAAPEELVYDQQRSNLSDKKTAILSGFLVLASYNDFRETFVDTCWLMNNLSKLLLTDFLLSSAQSQTCRQILESTEAKSSSISRP